MNSHPTYSFDQVLESINEMRQTLRSGSSSSGWDVETPFWQEAGDPTDVWFEDCEFDPRMNEQD